MLDWLFFINWTTPKEITSRITHTFVHMTDHTVTSNNTFITKVSLIFYKYHDNVMKQLAVHSHSQSKKLGRHYMLKFLPKTTNPKVDYCTFIGLIINFYILMSRHPYELHLMTVRRTKLLYGDIFSTNYYQISEDVILCNKDQFQNSFLHIHWLFRYLPYPDVLKSI